MTFCKHMREAIIDEKKAVPDYEKLRKEARELLTSDFPVPNMSFLNTLHDEVGSIIGDEERHAEILIPLFDRVCPRMAIHRKGVYDDEQEPQAETPRRPRYRRQERKHHRRHMEGY